MEKDLHYTEKMASVELNDLRDHNDDLPPPAIAHHQQQPRTRAKLSATTIIPVWIVLSSGVIIYNNYIYNTLNFKFPVFLVTWHLTFAVSCLQLFSFILELFFVIFFFFLLSTLSSSLSPPLIHTPGNRHSRPSTHNSPPRRRQGCPRQQRHVLTLHPPHWPPLLGQSHPQQYCLSLLERGLYPDVEGALIHPHRFALSSICALQLPCSTLSPFIRFVLPLSSFEPSLLPLLPNPLLHHPHFLIFPFRPRAFAYATLPSLIRLYLKPYHPLTPHYIRRPLPP